MSFTCPVRIGWRNGCFMAGKKTRPLVFRLWITKKGNTMKVHDFAYQVALRTIVLLEEKQQYKVSEENRKQILSLIHGEVDSLLDKAL
ncbi:MAG: hypothetical protein L3K26_10590 [Candidatus Hydrogenedentes bacterium]|nr:hypothetical protein [Candidatus Hydrogenedentota bacterium]